MDCCKWKISQVLAACELYSLNCSLLAKQVFYLCSCSQKNHGARVLANVCKDHSFLLLCLLVKTMFLFWAWTSWPGLVSLFDAQVSKPSQLHWTVEHAQVCCSSKCSKSNGLKNFQNKHDDFHSCRAESFSWLHRSQVHEFFERLPHFQGKHCNLLRSHSSSPRPSTLSNQKSAFKSNHALIYGNMFVGQITLLAVF